VIGRALLLAGLAWGAAAAAAGPGETLAAATARVATARAALEAAERAPDPIGALSVAIADYEAALAALRGGVAEAAARERELALDLAGRREQTARLLATLQALERSGGVARTLHPQGPLAAARAEAMLARMTPELRQAAQALAAELGDLAAARRTSEQGGADLAAGVAALNGARAELRAAIDAAPGLTAEPDPALAAMARNSETLTALAAALAGPGDDAADGAADGAPGAFRLPVEGEVLRAFNQPDGAGERRPGMVLAALPQSLVTAPADGAVRYAGPFLDYGYVLVLETEPDTLVVLAGLAQLRVGAGGRVRRGELLGLLGGPAPDAEEYVMARDAGTGAGAAETLYIEIRHGRGPVDPAPWFAGDNG
jgi:septal ring factor EnvC (AmiA/AmiB activator)